MTTEENDKWLPAMDMGPYLPELMQNLRIKTYMDELSQSRRMLIESLKSISFDDFIKRINEYDPINGCNLAWALYHMVEDEIYHSGQISIIRKLYKETIR